MHHTRVVLLAVLLGAVGLAPSATEGRARLHVEYRRRRPLVTRADIRMIRVASGTAVKRFEFSEPEGAIRLLRVTAPQGTHARLTGRILGTAGVSISIPRGKDNPAEVCRQTQAMAVCTQWEEACPMPPATWHFRLRKLAGPPGEIRVEFVVGR